MLGAALFAQHSQPSSEAFPETGLLCGSIFALLAFSAGALAIRRGLLRRGWTFLLGAAWAGCAGLGTLWPRVEGAADAEASKALAGFFAFAAAMSLAALNRAGGERMDGEAESAPRAVWILLGALALALAYAALHAVWQRYESYPRLLAALEADPLAFDGGPMRDAMMHHYREGRPGGPYGNANVCAGAMALGVALGLGLGAAGRSARGWAMGAALAGLCLFALALTQSRGGALSAAAALAGAAALAFEALRRGHGKRRALRRVWIAGAVLVALALAGSVWLARSPLGAQWRERMTSSSTVRARAHYLEVAWRMWRDAPWLGRGTGAFELDFPLYRSETIGEAKDPHNWLARAACENGLTGLAILLAWIAAAAGKTLLKYRQASVAALAALLGAGVLLLHGLLDFSFAVRGVYIDFCVLLGIAGAMAPARTGQSAMHGWLGWSGLGLAAAMLWPGWLRGDLTRIEENKARAAFEQAHERLAEGAAVRARLEALRGEKALARARKLEPRNPWPVDSLSRHWLWLRDSGLAGAEALGRAIDLAREAVSLHPASSSIRDRLAGLYFEAGRLDEAWREWDRSIGCHPFDAEPYARRARAFAQAGLWPLALEDARKAARYSYNVGERYERLLEDIEARAAQFTHRAAQETPR